MMTLRTWIDDARDTLETLPNANAHLVKRDMRRLLEVTEAARALAIEYTESKARSVDRAVVRLRTWDRLLRALEGRE